MGITKIFLVIFLIIVVLSIFDIKPSSLLLTVGTPLTVFSILLKSNIEDILFGIYLRISQIYKTGDRILLLEKNIEGYIKSFGLRLIEIKTLDNNIIYLRNFTFLNDLVVNKYNIRNCNIKIAIEAKFSEINNIKNIKNNLKEWVLKSPYFSQKITCRLKELTVDIFKMDIIIEYICDDISEERFVEAKLEFIEILADIIKQNNCVLISLFNTTE